MIWAERTGFKSVVTHFQVSEIYEVVVTCEEEHPGSPALTQCKIEVKSSGIDVTEKFYTAGSHAGTKITGEDVLNVMVNIFYKMAQITPR